MKPTVYQVFVSFKTDRKKDTGSIMLPDNAFKDWSNIYTFVVVCAGGIFEVANVLDKLVGSELKEIDSDEIGSKVIIDYQIKKAVLVEGVVLLPDNLSEAK